MVDGLQVQVNICCNVKRIWPPLAPHQLRTVGFPNELEASLQSRSEVSAVGRDWIFDFWNIKYKTSPDVYSYVLFILFRFNSTHCRGDNLRLKRNFKAKVFLFRDCYCRNNITANQLGPRKSLMFSQTRHFLVLCCFILTIIWCIFLVRAFPSLCVCVYLFMCIRSSPPL